MGLTFLGIKNVNVQQTKYSLKNLRNQGSLIIKTSRLSVEFFLEFALHQILLKTTNRVCRKTSSFFLSSKDNCVYQVINHSVYCDYVLNVSPIFWQSKWLCKFTENMQTTRKTHDLINPIWRATVTTWISWSQKHTKINL